MIFDITPFRTDKNIGKAYNERISVLPDDAWVVIKDGDCMYLTPDYGVIIEENIKRWGNEYAVIGALTNRIGVPYMLYKEEFSTNTDVSHHYNIANEVKNDIRIEESDLCAGYFMCFSKKTWKEVGGFQEDILYAPFTDKMFCKAIKYKGMKIGISQNLYVFHAYRIWETEENKARMSIKHLRR